MSTRSSTASPEGRLDSALGRGDAALIGILAALSAVGFGHFGAAVLNPRSSPFVAIGDIVIRFSPEFLTEFAKSTFGTADKPILLGGIGVTLTLLAAAAGLASRRTKGPGMALIGLLGLLGAGAVVARPGFVLVDLAAPTLAILVGLVVFAGLHTLAIWARSGPGRRIARDRYRVSRRAVLIGSSVAVAASSLAAGAGGLVVGGGLSESRSAVTARLRGIRLAERAPTIPSTAAFPESGTPSFITPNAEFYRIDVALQIPAVRAEDWALNLHGMLDHPASLTFDDLLARPLVERTITMTCVSNPVGGNLISTATFVGVDLSELLREAGIRPGADQLYSTSVDGWYTATPLDVLMEPGRGALLAVGMNGEALPPEHGFPVRMIVPGLYGYVSATKWLADLELTTFGAKRGYWNERGWAQRAPIKTQSRIDSPRGFATVPAGVVPVAGIAWSQPTGISAVEVRMDDGPWQRATLSTEVNRNTWRMWRTEFTLAPGSHTVQTRAIDRAGTTQTESRTDPIPDGASGWPATIFNAV